MTSPAPLPDEVRALAKRLGASDACRQDRVELAQHGTLRSGPGDRWRPFTAYQEIRIGVPEFRWRARSGPLGAIIVRDALWQGRPHGSVHLFGLVPLARARGSTELLQGELMRYLAELPWAPDALLGNPSLRWTVPANGRLGVEASAGKVTGRVLFTLSEDGLPVRVEGTRPRDEGGSFVSREWWGTFGDYRPVADRHVPFAAEVGWVVEGERFPVWRGRLTRWGLTGVAS